MSSVDAFDLEVEKMDAKTTYLHGDIEEETYMKQPKCCIVKGRKIVGL